MPLSTRLPLLALASTAALAVPTAAQAQAQSDCHLQARRDKVEHAIPGTGLTARDPYGGLLTRNRLFFDFSVRGSDADLAKVAKVQWSMDGKVVREDPKAPFEWKGLSGSSKRMPAGDHTITVTVTPTTGDPASTQFALTATDCQDAAFDAEISPRRTPATFTWVSAFESDDGEPLTAVSATATRNVRTALPRALRGKAIGSMQIGHKTYTLKGARTALAKGRLKVTFVPGAKQFLKVSGLPAGTQFVTIKLKRNLAWVAGHRVQYRVDGKLSAASGSVSVWTGGTYA